MKTSLWPHSDLLDAEHTPDNIELRDHLGGFDRDGHNAVLDHLNQQPHDTTVDWHNVIEAKIRDIYPRLDIRFNPELQQFQNFRHLQDYNVHPPVDPKNFVCSFNGTAHISRKFVTALLRRRGWFDLNYSSKNFAYTADQIETHIHEVSPVDPAITGLVAHHDDAFGLLEISFGHNQYDHARNIYTLEHRLTESFVHLVSETMATSYQPFVTEKFLYSVVTRGLFVAYAQPGWHEHLERYYGFRRYSKIFDYSFDHEPDPVHRLLKLGDTIGRYSTFTPDEWRALRHLEQDTIEYNYQHYHSGRYLEHMKKFG